MRLEKILETIETKFKGKAYNEVLGGCEYKTDDGKKCAIGLFIPDGHDAEEFLGAASSLLHEYPSLKKHMPSKNTYLLNSFQRVHDGHSGLINGHFIENPNIETLSLDEQKMYLEFAACDIFGEQQ